MGPTNVVMDAHDVIVPEDMLPSMHLIVLPNGDTEFVMEEVYTDGIAPV